jgi:hypothetical protein
MSDKSAAEDFPTCTFEDGEDMLEFLHEKIENLAYFWTLWSKTFLEGLEGDARTKILTELVEKESEWADQRIIVRCDDDQMPGFKVLSGAIRRFQLPSERDGRESL